MIISILAGKLKDLYGVTVLSNAKLYRVREKALGGSFESHVEEFRKLMMYANMVLRTNPGTLAMVISIVVSKKARVEGSGDPLLTAPVFRRIFINLHASQKGFIEV